MNENTCVSGYKTRNTLQGRKPRRYFPVSVPKRQIVINLNFSLKCLKFSSKCLVEEGLNDKKLKNYRLQNF